MAIIFLAGISAETLAQQTETRNVGSFSGIKATEGIDVYLKKGDKESVRVEVTGTNTANVITEVSGSYLKIHMKDGRYSKVDAKVYVTYVSIDKLSASSAASIFSEGTVKASNLEISASSAGTVEISVEGGSLEVSASSAGEVDLKGKAISLTADTSSGGEIDAYDLETENVEAEASSGSSTKVFATKALTANASSGGEIRYHGNPAKSVTNSSSGGSVKKSN